MGNLKLILSAALVASSAFAAEAPSCPVQALTCLAPEIASRTQSGQTLVVELAGGETSSTAIVEELTFSKEQQTRIYKRLAELPCKVAPTRPGPDSTAPVLTCEDPRLADAGYVVELSGADIAGLQRARVLEHRFAGTVELARVPCQR